MTNRLFIPYLLFILLFMVGCFPLDRESGIKIENKSNCNVLIYADYILPDTLLSIKQPKLYKINPQKYIWFFCSSVNDQNLKMLEQKDLTFFVLREDTLNKYSWDKVKKENMIIKRYNYSYEDFKNGSKIIIP